MAISRQKKRVARQGGQSDRLQQVIVFVLFLASVLCVRMIYLQVFRHGTYEALAEAQHQLQAVIEPLRGSIFASSAVEPGTFTPLASNRTYGLAYAVPQDVEDPEKTADEVLKVLPGLEREKLIAQLKKPEDLYEELAHKLTDEERRNLNDKNLKGIYVTDERVRYYPEKNIGSHLLGFVGFKGDERVGQYGLEGALQDELAGKKGFVRADRDAAGRWIVIGTRELEQAQDGSNIFLTIDETIQYTACTKLDAAVKKHGADSGSVVIMNPKTGAILAMCGSPDYDPNAYQEVKDLSVFSNPVVSGAYEPGSIFKPLTMSAAINEAQVGPQTTYTDEGVVEIGKYSIKNSDGKANGVQTMTQVLEKSLNTGAIFAMRSIRPEKFKRYVQNYGFGEKTGINLQGEVEGNVTNLDLSGDIYPATASFGQGITVTPIQLVAAFGAMANRGTLMKPYVVQKIVTPEGQETVTKAQEVRQVIRPEVATTIGAMLVNVVENGHGTRAGVDGYWIAGKTGTAQVKQKDGVGYDPNNTIGSFAGFGPVSDPAFAMVVRIDHPRDVTFAESTAAPLFGDIAKFLLHYLQIPPDRVE